MHIDICCQSFLYNKLAKNIIVICLFIIYIPVLVQASVCLTGRNCDDIDNPVWCDWNEKSVDGTCVECSVGPSWNDGTQCLYDDVITSVALGQSVEISLDSNNQPQYSFNQCAVGEYCSGGSQLWMERCQRGYYAEDYATCTVCDGLHTGFYGSNGFCYSCTEGFVPDFTTDNDCKKAPSGYHSDGFGLIVLPAGWYSELADTELYATLIPAEQCTGYVSSNGECFTCDSSTTFQVANPYTNSCVECPAGHECPTGRWDDISECVDGYVSSTGEQYCTACSNMFYGVLRSECLTCNEGDYYDQHTASCFECEPGYYCTSIDATPAGMKPGIRIPCPKGTYSENPGQTSCVECEGLVSNHRSACRSATIEEGPFCDSGYFYNPGANMFDNNCEICPGGYECPNDYTVIPCDKGHVSPPGSTQCTVCEEGTHQNNERTECILCDDGYYWNTNNGECTICPINHRCSKNEIAPCPEFYSAVAGSSDCISCEHLITGVDLYKNSASSGIFIPGGTCCDMNYTEESGCGCLRGNYFNIEYDEDNSVYVGTCTGCPVGNACFNSLIIECPRGLYQNNVELDTCLKCSGGYPVDSNTDPYHTAYSSCENCATTREGTFINESTLTCNTCPPGYYCSEGIQYACPDGYYQSASNQSSCRSCAGVVSIDRTSCDACEPGMYYNDEEVCIECETGYYCQDGLEIECPSGYYMNSKGSSACVECSGTVSSDRSECYLGVAASLDSYKKAIDGEDPFMVWITWAVIFGLSVGLYFLVRYGCYHIAIKSGLDKPPEVVIK